MRPIYESAQNKTAERKVITALSSTIGGDTQFVKLKDLAVFDYMAISDGTPCALIEIKARNNAADKYPTLLISERKIKEGLEVATKLKMPFILIVSWLDDVRWVRVKEVYPVAVGGRYDRGDAQDIERVCHIPVGDFKKI